MVLLSGDHVGLVSRSTPAAMKFTLCVFKSYTPMKLWVVRLLENATLTRQATTAARCSVPTP